MKIRKVWKIMDQDVLIFLNKVFIHGNRLGDVKLVEARKETYNETMRNFQFRPNNRCASV